VNNFAHFTRQPDSTHAVIYGNGAGELLCSYWPSEDAARTEVDTIHRLAESEGFDAHPRIESLAELDELEGLS
jgi:hypothetical protein